MEFKRPPREPDIEAEIEVIPTDCDGRRSPMFSGYRPNHDFGVEGMLNDALHEYPDSGQLNPGAKGRALLWFLCPEHQLNRLYEGMHFTVQEGRRVVGRGVILKVLNETLRK